MARKTIFVLVLCILALSCVYAGKSNIVIQGSPFSFQNVSTSSGNYRSTYGYGAEPATDMRFLTTCQLEPTWT